MKRVRVLGVFVTLAIQVVTSFSHGDEWRVIETYSPGTTLGGHALGMVALNGGAAAMSSGRGHVFVRDSTAQPWRRVSPDINGERPVIKGLIASLGAGGKLYAHTNADLYVTEDLGESWQKIEYTIDSGLSLKLESIKPTIDSSVLYARTVGGPLSGRRIAKSVDAGLTWQALGTPSTIGLSDYNVDEFVPSAIDTTTVLAVTQGVGIYISSDSGVTWTSLPMPLGGGQSSSARTAVFGANSNDTIFASRFGSIYWSTDQGSSWQTSDFLGEITFAPFQHLVADSADGNAVYFAGYGVLRFDSATSSVEEFGWINPDDAPVDLSILTDGTLIAASLRGARKLEGGTDFVDANQGFNDIYLQQAKFSAPRADGSRLIYALSEYSGVVVYDDSVESWSLLSDGLPVGTFNQLDTDTADPLRLGLATSNGLFSSSIGGINWNEITPQAASSSDYRDLHLGLDGQRVYAEDVSENVLVSYDSGASWALSLAGIDCVGSTCSYVPVMYSPFDDNLLIKVFASEFGLHFSSQNGGQTWSDFDWPVSYQGASGKIAFGPDGALYAYSVADFAKSADFGASWTVLPNPNGNLLPSIGQLWGGVDSVEPHKLLMLGSSFSTNSLLLFNTDDGSWIESSVPDLPCEPSICSVIIKIADIDPSVPGRALVVTSGGSVLEYFGDRDGDGLLDYLDNCISVENQAQVDSDGDGIGNTCDPDIAPPSNDCVVNFLDIQTFAVAFNSQSGDANWNADADLNNDSNVNFLDFSILTASFLKPPGPSGSSDVCR